jgi:hypothetical protein
MAHARFEKKPKNAAQAKAAKGFFHALLAGFSFGIALLLTRPRVPSGL